MSELELRSRLGVICHQLDARARRATRRAVLPVLLCTGMALSGGCDGCREADTIDNTPVPPYGVVLPPESTQHDTSGPTPDRLGTRADAGPARSKAE